MVKTDDPQVGRHVDVYVEMASMPLALWLVFSALFISILAIILMLMMWYKLRRGRKQNLDKPLRNFSGIPVDPASYEKVDSAPADDYSQSAIYQAPYVKSAIIPQEDSRGKKAKSESESHNITMLLSKSMYQAVVNEKDGMHGKPSVEKVKILADEGDQTYLDDVEEIDDIEPTRPLLKKDGISVAGGEGGCPDFLIVEDFGNALDSYSIVTFRQEDCNSSKNPNEVEFCCEKSEEKIYDTYRDASNSPLYSNPFSSTATPRHYYSEPDLTINYNRPKSAAKMVASSLMETIRSSSSLYGGTLTTAISPDSKNNA